MERNFKAGKGAKACERDGKMTSPRKGGEKSIGAKPSPLTFHLEKAFQPTRAFADSKWITNPLRLFLLLVALSFFFLIAYSFLAPPPRIATSFSEEPLRKVADVQIRAGERYLYIFNDSGGESAAGISAAYSRGCPGLLLYDKALSEKVQDSSLYSLCVANDGVQLSPNGTRIGGNLTYDGISWPYFSPWMLAVGEGFDWGANATVSAENVGVLSSAKLRIRYLGEKTYGGRKAFHVAVYLSSPNGGSESEISSMLVDSEKRFLLQSSSGNSTISLISAPFALNFSS